MSRQVSQTPSSHSYPLGYRLAEAESKGELADRCEGSPMMETGHLGLSNGVELRDIQHAQPVALPSDPNPFRTRRFEEERANGVHARHDTAYDSASETSGSSSATEVSPCLYPSSLTLQEQVKLILPIGMEQSLHGRSFPQPLLIRQRR